jgi:dipeptidyl aminopeptidase/acylaminoacyl peptidase
MKIDVPSFRCAILRRFSRRKRRRQQIRVMLDIMVVGLSLALSTSAGARSDEVPRNVEKPPPPYDFISWALRPDGAAAAYVLRPAAGEGAAVLLYQDLRTRAVRQLSGWTTKTTERPDLRPTWSPDGSQLAYLLPANGVSHLHVWRVTDGSIRAFERQSCASTNDDGCKASQLEWSLDSRYIYFLAQPDGKAGSDNPSSIRAVPTRASPEWRRLLFADPENGGVTIRESIPPKHDEGLEPTFLQERGSSDVVVADTLTGAVKTVLVGTDAIELHISPDGRRLLVVASTGRDSKVAQVYSDYFVVTTASILGVQPVVPVASHDSESRAAGDAQPVLHDVLQSIGPAAWSPDSRTIAFVDRGALAQGDIHLLDVISGKVRNLTAAPLPMESGEEVETVADVDRNYPGAKFNDTRFLSWSATGDALYALRNTPFKGGWKMRLWRVSLTDGAVNLSAGSPYDVGLPLFNTRPLPGGDSSLIVPIRLPATGEAGFAALSETSKRLAVLAKLPGDFRHYGPDSAMFSKAGESALFVSESSDAPQEAFDLNRNGNLVKQLTSLNVRVRDRHHLPRRYRIAWRTTANEERFGYLYVQRVATDPPPLIVQVYPRYPNLEPLSGTTYLGNPDTFLPPLVALLQAGYALFKPDLPVAGNGKTCDDVTLNLDLALKQIDHQKLADINRAAIIGMSFGGWTVNCVITRTRGFHAAVSVAGYADLVSTSFADGTAAAVSVSGGQTLIRKSIWEAPDLYWYESPVSGVEHVVTPLLLIHGKLDTTIPVYQSVEMYTALSRLGKEVELVTYDDTDHHTVLIHPDYQKRVIEWIDRHIGSATENAQLGAAAAGKSAGH